MADLTLVQTTITAATESSPSQTSFRLPPETDSSSDKQVLETENPLSPAPPDQKKKKSVSFNDVKLFLFERTQGFECIPSDDSKNSITLGMSYKHSYVREFEKLEDYLKYKRKTHLKKLEQEKKKILSNDENILDSIQVLTCDDLIEVNVLFSFIKIKLANF